MIDHHSYTHNLSSCKIKARKNSSLKRDLNSWPRAAILVQCSTNWAIKPSGSWSHYWAVNLSLPYGHMKCQKIPCFESCQYERCTFVNGATLLSILVYRLQRIVPTDTHMTTRQPQFFRLMLYHSHTAMKVITCMYSTVYSIDKTGITVKPKTG